MEASPLTLKVRMLTAEVMATLLYGCVTWGRSARSTSLTCERHTTGFSYGSLASSADIAQISSCRTPRPHEGTMLERRDDHQQAAFPFCGGRTTDEK